MRRFWLGMRAAAAAIAIWLHATGAGAQEDRLTQDQQMEIKAAWAAASEAAIRGPAQVPLLDQATLTLAPARVFVPPAQAARVLRAFGNRVVGDQLQGLIVGSRDTDQWMIVVSFDRAGHVRDDEAKSLSADAILAGLREGAEADNRERVQRGFPELELLGWTEPPAYDSANHRRVWAWQCGRKAFETRWKA